MVVESQIILKYDPEHERFLDQVEVISVSRKSVFINDQEYIQRYIAITSFDLTDEVMIPDVVNENERRAFTENDKKVDKIQKLVEIATECGWDVTVQLIDDC